MTSSEIRHRLKKSLISFVISLIVFIISIFMVTTVTANAEAAATEATQTTQEENIVDDKGNTLASMLDVNDNNGNLELVLLITILSIAPSLLVLMTSFTRIIIVFSLLRNAIGTQQTPPNSVLVGLALFLTFFIMTPVFKEMNEVAYQPYKNGDMTTIEAAKAASVPIKEWMLEQTSQSSMDFILEIGGIEMPQEDVAKNLGIQIVVPAFVLSEIKRAFIIGFLLYIPFLIIDIVVASTLMSMGMIMLPPATISLPFKLLLFIVVNGWEMLVGALVSGFN